MSTSTVMLIYEIMGREAIPYVVGTTQYLIANEYVVVLAVL